MDTGRWIYTPIDGGTRMIWIADSHNTPAFQQFLEGIHDTPFIGQPVSHERNYLTALPLDAVHGLDIPIIIKRLNLSRPYDQLRFHVLNSKAQRALNIALALGRIDVNTPRPIAVVDERSPWNQLLRSTFIS